MDISLSVSPWARRYCVADVGRGPQDDDSPRLPDHNLIYLLALPTYAARSGL